ncbi:MAG: thioredoxin domain-containing protein [Chitinophagales bacterium]
MKKKLAYTLTLLGLSSSLYLFHRYLQLIRKQTDSSIGFCSLIFGEDCDAFLIGGFSGLFSLSWSAWGILYFSVILSLLLLHSFLGKDFEKTAFTANIAWLGLGNIVSVGLLILMFLEAYPFCKFCLVIHLFNISLLGVLWTGYEGTIRQFFSQMGLGLKYLFTGQSEERDRAKWKLLGFGFVILFGLCVYQRALLAEKISPLYLSEAPSNKAILSDFASQPIIEIPFKKEDAKIGNTEAPIKIVVFSDFECPYCASFAEETQKWVQMYPNQLQIVFKHFPLSSQCNADIQGDLHPNACQAAFAAQAAHNQGQFSAFHDRLFQSNLQEADYLVWAEEMEMDVKQFEEDYKSEASSQKIRQDIELANTLEVEGTPSVFINGRKIKNANPQNIELLIGELVN